MPREKVTVLDMKDCRDAISLYKGVQFAQERITKENYQEVLKKYVGAGDLIVDLTWNIECDSMLDWCHTNRVLYMNTSVEDWDPYFDANRKLSTDRTLYARQMEIRQLVDSWNDPKGTTAVVDHGANPGLVSHFTKVGLVDIAQKILDEKPQDQRAPL